MGNEREEVRSASRKRSYMRVMESDEEEVSSTDNSKKSSSRSRSADLHPPSPSLTKSLPHSEASDYGVAQPNQHESDDEEFSVVKTDLDMNFLKSSDNYRERRFCAQPVIGAAWAGDFSVKPTKQRNVATFEGLQCCVSSNACREARLAAEQLPAVIRWEKLPKWCVWPKAFQQRGGPTDDDIALFFFPSLAKHATVYESLLFDLIRGDWALRTVVMGSELLLFTSVDLPPLSTRFQAKLYLWGLFLGNNQPRL